MNLEHVFGQGNPVLISVFLLLTAMSVASWYIIFLKIFNVRAERKYLVAFKAEYMQAANWPVHNIIKNVRGNIAGLVSESARLKEVIASHDKTSAREILTMHLCQRLDIIRASLDKGLTLLASIGSSAPFIGLFGTVWGIYGALTNISIQGNASLNVVAGPMGEALVATAIGLFAAIPAVLAYNTFVRINRLMVQDLRHIAEQMATYLPLTFADPESNIRAIKGGR